MTWMKLIDYPDDYVCAGSVFRFPAHYLFEPLVDFMLYFDASSESGFFLALHNRR